MTSPREDFAALERRDYARVQEGTAHLRGACKAARHADVYTANEDRSGDALDELVQEYVAFLYSTKGAAERPSLDTWLGLRVSFTRFLKRSRRRDKSIERQLGLYKELLFDKIRKVLGDKSRFEQVPPPRPARFHLTPPPAQAKVVPEDVLSEHLPTLPSRLDPVGKQSPEVVDRAQLADQLERVFTCTSNQPRTPQALHSFVWPTLSPQPEDARRHTPPNHDETEADILDGQPSADIPNEALPGSQTPEDFAAAKEFFEERVDELAFAFLRGLTPRCRQVASCRWTTAEENGARSVDDVSQLLSIARATVGRDFKDFDHAFEKCVKTNALDALEAKLLLSVVEETLAAGDVQPLEGAAP